MHACTKVRMRRRAFAAHICPGGICSLNRGNSQTSSARLVGRHSISTVGESRRNPQTHATNGVLLLRSVVMNVTVSSLAHAAWDSVSRLALAARTHRPCDGREEPRSPVAAVCTRGGVSHRGGVAVSVR